MTKHWLYNEKHCNQHKRPGLIVKEIEPTKQNVFYYEKHRNNRKKHWLDCEKHTYQREIIGFSL